VKRYSTKNPVKFGQGVSNVANQPFKNIGSFGSDMREILGKGSQGAMINGETAPSAAPGKAKETIADKAIREERERFGFKYRG